MKKSQFILGTLSITFLSINTFAGVKVPDYDMSSIGKAPLAHFEKVKIKDTDFKKQTVSLSSNVSGLDDIIIQENEKRAILFSMDHTVKVFDFTSGTMSEIATLNIMPAGAVVLPGSPDNILFCATRGHLREYPLNPPIGLYLLNLKTKKLDLIFNRVPKLDQRVDFGYIPNVNERLKLNERDMNEYNSRLLEHCNDLAITNDGKRVYITEPFDTIGSTDGGPLSQEEAFLLKRNGMIWKVDFESKDISLVAQNLRFPDGILVKNKTTTEVDDTIIFSELSQYRILEINFKNGDSAVKTLIDGLPGSPDGLTFDKDGNIWVAFVKERTKFLNLAHRFPALKKLMLKLPEAIKPVPKGTGFMKISQSGIPLLYVQHDGSKMTDIAAVTPGFDGLFLSTYNADVPGLFYFDLKK